MSIKISNLFWIAFIFILVDSTPSRAIGEQNGFASKANRDGQTENGGSDLMDMSLEQLLDIKISIASKLEEKTSEAPSSVSVFTQSEIQALGITYLEELLNFVPGFQATREIEQGTQIRVGVRGKSTAMAESILLLINGQRINDLYSGGFAILNRHITVENIERVEIIRGPGSALYGANAFVGVINIITSTDESNISLQAGNQNSRSGAINLSKSFADNDLTVSGFVHAFSDDGFKYRNLIDVWGIQGDTIDPRSGYDAHASLAYKQLTLHLRHMERHFEDFIAWGNLQPTRGNGREYTKQSSLKLDYRGQVTKSMQLTVSAGYCRDSWKSISISVPYGEEIAPGLMLDQAFHTGPFIQSYAAFIIGNLEIDLHPANKLIVGATYERAGITTVSNLMDHNPVTLEYLGRVEEFDAPEETFNEKKNRSIVGLFIQDKQSLTNNINIVAGLRYDWYNDFGHVLSPRIAATASLPIDARVKLIYGRAFRAPSFLELYDKNNPIDFGNPDLGAEKIDTFEIAYVQSIKDRLQASVTFYYSMLSDFIEFGEPVDHPNNPLGAPGFVNSDQTILLRGLELDFKAQPIDNLLLVGSFSHLIEANGLLMSPNTGSLAASYKIEKLTLSASAIFHDAVKSLPVQDAYILLGARLAYNLTPSLKFTINISNILNERIRTASSVLADGVPNRGRTILLGLVYHL